MRQRLDRGAWLTLAIAALMLVWGAAGTLYFFSLPTDGWLVADPPAADPVGFIYTENGAGAPSELQPGDQVTAIEGIISNQGDLRILSNRWQAGNSFEYTVERGGKTLIFLVPLVRWSFIPAVQIFVQQNGGISELVGQLLFLSIAAFTFFRRPADHAAQALFILATLGIIASTLVNLFISNPTVLVFPASKLFSELSISAVFTVLFPPTLLRLSLVFPRPKPVVQRYPILEYVPYLIGLLVVPAFILTTGVAGYLWTVSAVLVMIVILIHSAMTMKDALSRAQMVWGLWGVIVSMLLFLLTYAVLTGLVSGVLAEFFNTLSTLSSGVLGATLSIAILRYRLFDISFFIQRTLLYTALTAILALVYFSGVVLFQQFFRAISGQESDVALVLSTLTIAVLFNPLRQRLQRIIDRFFYRQKYNAEQAVAAFASAARSEVELDELGNHLVVAAQEALQPKSILLWLKKQEDNR